MIKPYYENDYVKIYLGDCLEVLPQLPYFESVDLFLTDPPYGMGKESEGVANDNLYREKLDAFLMSSWKAARPLLKFNASAYIWGNPEDLWRLWYIGGLKDSEVLTFRNELVWDKKTGFGMKSAGQRSYTVTTERCLFFMLGRQFFGNVNTEDFFEGFEPIRAWLEEQAQTMKWGPKKIKEITGVGMYSHWFSKSQWTLIPENHYVTLQEAAKGRAFCKPYSEIKEGHLHAKDGGDHLDIVHSFNEMRAYFDNAHDIMGEVWQHPRVQERWNHPTPKPTALFERMIISSCPEGGIVLDPFIGSGTTAEAAMRTRRQCLGVELDEGYCETIAKRCEQIETGLTPGEQDAGQLMLFDIGEPE